MTETDIYQKMLETFRQETGYEMAAEADLAVRLRAAAAQIMSLYQYADYTYRQAFPQTAEGDSLELHGALRGVERLGAVKAGGYLRFSVSEALYEDLLIPAGTVCVSRSLRSYATGEDAVLPAGHTGVEVYAYALEGGSDGNTEADTIVMLQSPPDGIQNVTNPGAFLGGRDEEDDESYRQRILSSYRSLANGANAAYYKAMAEQVEGVEYVSVVPRIDGVGTVAVVLAASGGQVPVRVLAAVADAMEACKSLGVDVRVLEAEDVSVNISMTLTPAVGVTLEEAKAKAEAALAACFRGNRIGMPLYLAELTHGVMATGKVNNVMFSAPAGDVTVTATQRLVPGIITVEGA